MMALYIGRRFGVTRGLLLLPILIGALAALSPSRSGELTMDDESAAGRVDAWYEGFEMFRAHPLFGVGAGLFTDHHPMTAHNSFVLAIAELGVVGYTVWFANLAVSAVMLWRLLTTPEPARAAPPEAPRSGRRVPANGSAAKEPATTWADIQGAAAALAYAGAGSLVAAFFLSRSYVVFLYLLVALIVAVYQLARRDWPALAPVRLGPLFGRFAALAIGSIIALWLITRVLLSLA
jgi:O-antigen ligase